MKPIGPGYMVTAGIIGPGNLTAASIAGSLYGFDLLWVIVFGIFTTFILQDMAARLGLITHQGLSESIRKISRYHTLNRFLTAFVIIVLLIGNSLFVAGSITGIAISLKMTAVDLPISSLIILSSLLATIIPLSGLTKYAQPMLIGFIVLMGLGFIITMLVKPPDVHFTLKGLLPSIPSQSLFTIVAMVGSLLPTYNLFLHAGATAHQWPDQFPSTSILRCSRIDTFISLGIAGALMTAVLTTAASLYFNSSIQIRNLEDIAVQLEPAIGHSANMLFAMGLFAAALSCAVTCPMATAFAVCGAINGKRPNINGFSFRIIWTFVLLTGTSVAITFGHNAIAVIMFAQVINGILLPFVALLLLVAINKASKQNNFRNCHYVNILSVLVVAITFILGVVHIVNIFTS